MLVWRNWKHICNTQHNKDILYDFQAQTTRDGGMDSGININN